MLDQDTALLVLNVLGPLDGRKIKAAVVRGNVNAKATYPVTRSEFEDQIREMKEREWIAEDFDAFGKSEIGITAEGQQVRKEHNQ